MKDLGAYLKSEREENGVSIDEAAMDLEIKEEELENIEAGNTRAFKDIYVLRDIIKKYAKYLGLDVKKVAAEFNDFLFEHTSKISIEDIMAASKEQEENRTIMSPYTKEVKKKIDFAPIVLCVLICIFIVLVIYLLIGAISTGTQNKKSSELKNVEEVYEFTY